MITGISIIMSRQTRPRGWGEDSDGVCFRATCPGIVAVMHRRVSQASFRRRHITYRHYAFRGTWELKDRGAIESVAAPVRELFLVLPDDLIEFRLPDPDMNAQVELINGGYIKRGCIAALRKWLAYNIYLERPVFRRDAERSTREASRSGYAAPLCRFEDLVKPIQCVGRFLGLPWF